MKSRAAQRSRAQQAERWQLHSRCESEVRQQGPHWGVYCVQHGRWIQWIGRDQVRALGIDPEKHHK